MELSKAREEIEEKVLHLLMGYNNAPGANGMLFEVYISVLLVNEYTANTEYAEKLTEYIQNGVDKDFKDIYKYWFAELVPKEIIESSEADETENE